MKLDEDKHWGDATASQEMPKTVKPLEARREA
jgi:hypothetical protein